MPHAHALSRSAYEFEESCGGQKKGLERGGAKEISSR